MGNAAAGGVVTVSIANRSNKTILYRYYDEIAYTRYQGELTASNYRAGGLAAGGASANFQAFDHRKHEGPGFNRLPPLCRDTLSLNIRGQPVVYVTIMTEDCKIIWHNNPQDRRRNIVIMEDLQIRDADVAKPFERHVSDRRPSLSQTPMSTRLSHPRMQSLHPREALNMYLQRKEVVSNIAKTTTKMLASKLLET